MFRKLTSTAIVLGTLTLALTGCPAEKPKGGDDSSASDGEGDGAGTGGTDKPDKPVVKAKPFDLSTAKTPWKHAKVGDWALYDMRDAKKTMRFEITKVDGLDVTFTVKDEKSGELINEPTINIAEEDGRYKDPMTYDGLAKDENGKDIKPYTESVTIKGKTIEALVIKRAGLGTTTELWIAEKDVRPFNQCAVKSLKDDKLKIELLDFGSK